MIKIILCILFAVIILVITCQCGILSYKEKTFEKRILFFLLTLSIPPMALIIFAIIISMGGAQ